MTKTEYYLRAVILFAAAALISSGLFWALARRIRKTATLLDVLLLLLSVISLTVMVIPPLYFLADAKWVSEEVGNLISNSLPSIIVAIFYSRKKYGDNFPRVYFVKTSKKVILSSLLIGMSIWFVIHIGYSYIIPLWEWSPSLLPPQSNDIFDGIQLLLLAPVFEEILFRGFILDILRSRYKQWIAILISSILFALIHVYPIKLFPTFCFAVFVAFLKISSASLWPCVLAHLGNNLMSRASYYLKVPEEYDWIVVSTTILVLMFGFRFIRKSMN